MQCPVCGHENRAGARFCVRCGRPLAEATLPPAAPETPSAAVEAVVPPTAEEASELAEESAAVEPPAGPEPAAPEAMAEEAAPAAEEPVAPQAEVGAEAGAGKPPAYQELVAGTRLLDRYEIIELVESGPSGKVYAAYDLRRCPQCDFSGNEPGSEYCAHCGVTIITRPRCLVRQQPAAGQADVADQFVEGDCLYTVTLEPRQEAIVPPRPRGISLRWGKKTDVGRMREVNEDMLDVRVYAAYDGPTLGLFVVADGVGGQDRGEVASRLATDTIWAHIRERVWQPEMAGQEVSLAEMQGIVREAVQAANQAVYKERIRLSSEMGTTVTLALLRDTRAVIANVGDSRTYLWGPEGLRRLSVDHSVVESLVASGEIKREQIYTHPQRNLIYRSLGDRPSVEVDLFEQELAPGNRLILCSDGLWEMVRDEGLEEMLLSEADPQRACDVLVDRANMAGGEDNITIIIVQVEGSD